MAKCNLIKRPLGIGNCPSMPEYFRRKITTKQGFSIPKATIDAGNAAIIAYLQTAILNKDIYLWPQMFASEDQSEETVYQSTPLGKRAVREGFPEWLISYSDSLFSHTAMYTHRATTGRSIFVDTAGQLHGTSNDAGDFLGLSMQLLHTEKMKPNTGSEVATSPVRIVLSDTLEFDRDGALLPVSGINTLIELTEATVSVVSSIATAVVVDVKISADGTPLQGLVNGDFILLTTAGAAQTISSVVESPSIPGRYTLNGTGLVTGTVNLAAPVDISIPAYESMTAQIVTI